MFLKRVIWMLYTDMSWSTRNSFVKMFCAEHFLSVFQHFETFDRIFTLIGCRFCRYASSVVLFGDSKIKIRQNTLIIVLYQQNQWIGTCMAKRSKDKHGVFVPCYCCLWLVQLGFKIQLKFSNNIQNYYDLTSLTLSDENKTWAE